MSEFAASLGKRALALVVLVIAAWILLKMVIGLVAGLATTVVVLVAVLAIFWAVRTL